MGYTKIEQKDIVILQPITTSTYFQEVQRGMMEFLGSDGQHGSFVKEISLLPFACNRLLGNQNHQYELVV